MDENSLDRVKQVFEEWSLYDLIIQHNYMRHSELVECLRQFVNQTTASRNIVDLGCGDAWLAKHVFDQTEVQSYLGVDLSDTALGEAASQLSSWTGEVKFTQGDIAEFLADNPPESVDTALVSYSLHHFQDDHKRVLIEQIHRILQSGGQFLWIDLARTRNDTREAFLQRMAHHIQVDWKQLNTSQTEQAVQHILESDFPATEDWMIQTTDQVGLRLIKCLYRDDFFGAWAFARG